MEAKGEKNGGIGRKEEGGKERNGNGKDGGKREGNGKGREMGIRKWGGRNVEEEEGGGGKGREGRKRLLGLVSYLVANLTLDTARIEPSEIPSGQRHYQLRYQEEDREQIHFLGNNSSGTKKYRGTNSNNGGNTRDRVKIVGGVIGSGDEIDENTGGIILSVEFSKELKELLPNEAGK
ncbi:hypothetical protein Tco_0150813 [Tanacetum coccineum]